MKFSERLWKEIEPLYEEIINQPFVVELSLGTLSRDKFIFYLQQDHLYLIDFARAISITSSLAPSFEKMATMIRYANGIINTEMEVHNKYFNIFSVTPSIEKTPACFAYTNFLTATTTTGIWGESLAALLPCFWVYRDVGQHIYKTALQNNPYIQWIKTYSSPEFSEDVDKMIEMVNEAAMFSSVETQNKMIQLAKTSTYLEWKFWDDSYKMKKFLIHVDKR